MNGIKLTPFKYKWMGKMVPFKLQERSAPCKNGRMWLNGRISSRTNCKHNRIAFSRLALSALVSALVTLASSIAMACSPLLCWHHPPYYAGIAALVLLTSLPLLHWCCHCCWHGLTRCPWLSTCKGKDACKSTAQCKHNKGKEACIMGALMPVHQGQQCQCDKVKSTSATA